MTDNGNNGSADSNHGKILPNAAGAGRAIKEIEEKYRLLMELFNDGIIVVQEGNVRESNYYMAKMCGYSLEEVLDTSFTSFIHPDDMTAVESLLKRTLKDRNAIEVYQAKLMCKQGQQLQVEIRAVRCIYRKKPASLLIVKDISDRIKAKKDLEIAGKLDSIAALSGGIAHDYNNLLTAIIGNISLAQSYLKPRDRISMLLNKALLASKTAEDLTRKLITFSKGGEPHKQIASVAGLVKSATEFTLSGSNIKCEFRLPAGLWPVEIDPNQIGQAIHNVVINAKEAMPQGGILKVSAENVDMTEDFLTLWPDNYVRISITDRGSGIPDKDLNNIFIPYFSTKKLGSRKGTGLGLSICHSIIRKHGGDVAVESERDLGTTVHIYLPAIKEKTPTPRPTEKRKIERPAHGEGKILVMDDEKMIRDLAGEILLHLGYQVEFAQDGMEAVAKYHKARKLGRPFDAVILDLTVRGGMGGKETIQKLLEINPAVKGIVSSGYSDDPGMINFSKYGFKGVVAKPYTMGELGEKLGRVLEAKD